jgi:hypothetical protein
MLLIEVHQNKSPCINLGFLCPLHLDYLSLLTREDDYHSTIRVVINQLAGSPSSIYSCQEVVSQTLDKEIMAEENIEA